MSRLNRQTLGILIAIAGAVIYGIYPSALKAVYHDGANATFVMVFTTWMRALGLTAFCIYSQKALFSSREHTKSSLQNGAFQAISAIGIATSLLYISGTLLICIIFMQILMQYFYMVLRDHLKFNFSILLCAVFSLVGLATALDVWNYQSVSWIGVSLAFMVAVTTASRMYMYGKQTANRHPIIVGSESFICAASLLTPLLLFIHPSLPETLSGYGWLALASLSMIAGSYCMFYGIALLGSFSYSMFAKLEPIFTAIFSVLFINEILQWHQYFGIGVVIASLIAYQYISQRQVTSN